VFLGINLRLGRFGGLGNGIEFPAVLQLEDGGGILLEDGGYILLESTEIGRAHV
jgi:hypothetical protein